MPKNEKHNKWKIKQMFSQQKKYETANKLSKANALVSINQPF